MTFRYLSEAYAISPQITESDIKRAAKEGFRTIVSVRPDDEDVNQPTVRHLAMHAQPFGIVFKHIPVVDGEIDEADVSRMRALLAETPGPTLAYCRSGARAATLWALAKEPNAASQPSAETLVGTQVGGSSATSARAKDKYDVVIVGGGSAGIATAASLLRRKPSLNVAIIEPANDHFYQPGWTLVGGGVFSLEQTQRSMASVMPDRVTWIRAAAAGFAPESDEVILADGSSVAYRVLVAAPGVKLDWSAIAGLSETLGRNGVTSNYRFDLAPYTYQLVNDLKRGRALFSQPPLPIKCAGAPQKAMYLSCDIWSKARTLRDIEVEFHNAGTMLFGVPDYVPALMAYVERYGIQLRPQSTLLAVDGQQRIATFKSTSSDGATTYHQRRFDVLHAVPPQVAPDFVRASPLACPAGFIEIDHTTLRHPRFSNIYALGDACSAPNAKTAAAARKQAPVVAVNVLASLSGLEPVASYNGYGSCPLTVERGKIVLAEFGYGGKLLPTFPAWLLDGTKPTRRAWLLKKLMLPPVYWRGMLKGREWLASPEFRA